MERKNDIYRIYEEMSTEEFEDFLLKEDCDLEQNIHNIQVNDLEHMVKKKAVYDLIYAFRQYDEVCLNGKCGYSSDGKVLNDMRKIIILSKKRIEKLFDVEKYPKTYFRKTPDIVSEYLMINTDVIINEGRKLLRDLEENKLFKQIQKYAERFNRENIYDDEVDCLLRDYCHLKEAIDREDYQAIRSLFLEYYDDIDWVKRAYDHASETAEEQEIHHIEIKM